MKNGITIAATALYANTLDKEWVKSYLLKYFKWNSQNQISQYIWQAFIEGIYSKNPILSDEVFLELKQDFLEAIKHLNQKRYHQNLCYVLVYLFFHEDKYFDQNDLSEEFLSGLDIEKLEHIAFAIFQLLDSLGEKSHELWSKKINNWVKTSWPQDKKFVTPEISDNLVNAAIAAGIAFGKAIDTLSSKKLLTISSSPQFLLCVIRKLNSPISQFFPEESLEVLDKVLPKEIIGSCLTWYNSLDIKGCLENITKFQPCLLEDLRYKAINEPLDIYLEQYRLQYKLRDESIRIIEEQHRRKEANHS